MRTRHFLSLVMLCAVAITASAQSFSSLRRSTGSAEVYDAVEKALSGNGNMSECKSLIKSGDIGAPKKGKTPIYLVMDYIATHRKQDCGNAEQLLEAFLSRSDFDVNLRYGTLAPPMTYLIRTNYSYLGGRYSKDYISDKVLRLMIEAGASVNTYNTDGGTLMDFATATDNQYLQNYFIAQGGDLRHKDKKGDDVVYRLISSGNYEVVKQAIESGKIHVDINNLKNEPSSFAQYKELYDYLANHCAKQVSSYDEIVLFRSRFADKKDLALDKYETVARREVSTAQDYNSIMKCKNRFPDLTYITEPKFKEIALNDANAVGNIGDVKLCEKRYTGMQEILDRKKAAFYKSDVAALESSYSHAQTLIARCSFSYDASMADIAGSFGSNYKDYYDPENKAPLALDLGQFYFALSKVNAYHYRSYIHLPNPGIDHDNYEADKKTLKDAHMHLTFPGNGLSSAQMLDAINKKIKKVEEQYENEWRRYRDFCAELRENISVRYEKSPSGELTRGLLENYWHYRTEGEIGIYYNIPGRGSIIVTIWYNARYDDESSMSEPRRLVFKYYETKHFLGYGGVDGTELGIDIARWEGYGGNSYGSITSLGEGFADKIVRYYHSFL